MIQEKPTISSVKKIKDLDGINKAMAQIFQDAQITLSGHRKLVIVLKNIHRRACELGYREGFTIKFAKMVNKILPLKKGEQVGDRIAKFCSIFVSALYKEESDKRDGVDQDCSYESEDTSSLADNFVDYILRHLLRGIQAKDKNVRYRVLQLLAYIVNYVGEIDEELFKALDWSLKRRILDKEPNVRIQAVVAISNFQYINTPEEDKSTDKLNSATRSLLLAMQYDDSSEVRRAALLNLTKKYETIDAILERARDTNSINRRLVFSRISKEIGDFRRIDFRHRENLLRWGLYDRDESVRNCAIKMLSLFWMACVNNDIYELVEQLRVIDSEISSEAMLALYEARPDISSSILIPAETWKELTTDKAFIIRTFYEHCNNSNLYNLIERNYPESLELAQTLDKYLNLRSKIIESNLDLVMDYKSYRLTIEDLTVQLDQIRHDYDKLEREVADKGEKNVHTRELKEERARIIQRIKAMLKAYKEMEEAYNGYFEQLKELEFIIVQLLLLAAQYDFSDEMGRRKMLYLIRSSLFSDKLSERITEISLKILRKISINERDFVAMCVEIIADLQDFNAEESETFHSASAGLPSRDNGGAPQENEDDKMEDDFDRDENGSSSEGHMRETKQPSDDIIIQCLWTTKHMLELTEESMEDNYSLSSLLESLVRPAVLRNEQPLIRFLGIECLGLFTLFDKELAIENLFLFGIAATKASEDLRIVCVKTIIDILSVHGLSVLDVEGGVDSLSLARLFYKLLKLYDMPNLQCVVAEGLCKLFLADVLTNFGKLKESLDGNEGSESNGISEGPEGFEKSDEEDQEKQLLEALVLTYFHPLNANNDVLKQILAFCLPVYVFSHTSHQEKMASISGDCFFRMFRENGEFSRYQNTSTPTNVIQQLIHWCDPNNVVNFTESDAKYSRAPFWQTVSFLQAIEQDTPKSVKKVIIANLNKIFLTESIGYTILSGLKCAIEDTKEHISSNQHNPNFVFDSLTERNFEKFYKSISELCTNALLQGLDQKKETRLSSGQSDESNSNSRSSSVAPFTLTKERHYLEPREDPTQSNIGKEKMDEESKKSVDRDSVESSLEQIDDLLEKEENVEYDVSMEI